MFSRSVLPVVVVVVALLSGCSAAGEPEVDAEGPVAMPAAVSLPPLSADPQEPGYVGMVDADWVAEVAEKTGIPRLALAAYAGAVIRSTEVYPDCGIGWNTLAAIGLVESDHGRHDGSVLGPDYRAEPPIYGIALDGTETDHIPDSDGGVVDGDAEYDRAVGPMQLIPQTWASWPSDGNGDGTGDPQNIADAAIASAHHMCRASGGMSTPDGWRAGIAAYNSATGYARDVSSAADDYARAAER